MPMGSPEAQAEYQRQWVAKRRAKWFKDKCCIDCQATDDLQLDHEDPKLKVSHRIWSWSWKRIEEETSKCVVRCSPCHYKKTYENKEYCRGEAHGQSRFTEVQVLKIRKLAETYSLASVAEMFGVRRQTIWDIVHRRSWKHI